MQAATPVAATMRSQKSFSSRSKPSQLADVPFHAMTSDPHMGEQVGGSQDLVLGELLMQRNLAIAISVTLKRLK